MQADCGDGGTRERQQDAGPARDRQGPPLRCLSLRRRTAPRVALDLGGLGTLYRRQGRFAQAEPVFRRAQAIGEKVLGPEHPQVAASIVDLASLYRDQSRFAQAEPLYQWALTLQHKSLGPDHPDVAESLEEYAVLLKQTNREAEAAPLEAQAKAIRAKAP